MLTTRGEDAAMRSETSGEESSCTIATALPPLRLRRGRKPILDEGSSLEIGEERDATAAHRTAARRSLRRLPHQTTIDHYRRHDCREVFAESLSTHFELLYYVAGSRRVQLHGASPEGLLADRDHAAVHITQE
nr:hypothetical protein Iba_scaffold3571CG0070 [Ipomoea batatas]